MRMLRQVGQIDENGRRFLGWRVRVSYSDGAGLLRTGKHASLDAAHKSGDQHARSLDGQYRIYAVWLKESDTKRALRRLVKDCERFFGKETPALREARRVLGQ